MVDLSDFSLPSLSTSGWRSRVRWRVIPILTVALLLTICCATAHARSDKSFYHPYVSIKYEFNSDGSVDVEEVRSFDFNGRFSWAQLEKSTYGDYGRYSIEYISVEDAGTGLPLKFETISENGLEILKWYYSAKNERKDFLIRYRINGAIQKYGDVAQFYWKAIGDSHQRIGQIDIELIPPSPSLGLFKVFVHSEARPGLLNIADDRSRASVRQESVRRNRFVEIRALFDPAVFPDAASHQGESHASLLEDERRITEAWRAAEQKRIEAYRKRGTYLKIVIISGSVFLLLFIALYIYFFFSFGREHSVGYEGIYERQPPRDIPPSIVPAILTQSGVQIAEMGKSFAAALLESARLGYLEISEKDQKILMFSKTILVYSLTEKGRALLAGREVDTGRRERELISFEKDVLETVFTEAGENGSVTSEEIEKWAKKSSGSKTKYYKFIMERSKELRKEFESKFFKLDDHDSERAKTGFIIISMFSGIAFSLGFFFTTRHPVAFLFGTAVIVSGLILSIPLARRTREAAIEHKKWMAFKRFMTDFSAMKEAGPSLLQMWEEYLVFAVALGVADKLLSNLKLMAKEYNAPLAPVLWFHPVSASSMHAGQFDSLSSIESLSNSISNLQNLSTALSTSSSGGGGFSGGGGGGGGGGGCGAG